MNDIRKGKAYGFLFFLFLLFLVIGGYFLTKKLISKEPTQVLKIEEKEETLDKSIKINDYKEYIYFKDIEEINEELGIIRQNIVINIVGNDALKVQDIVNSKNEELKEKIELTDNLEEKDKNNIVYKVDNIHKMDYLKYTRYFSDNYISLIVETYNFDCFNGVKYLESEAYVFDIFTGTLLNNEELLERFNISIDKIKTIIQDKLNKEEKEEINIAQTLLDLDNIDNYSLYINKSGELVISYIVKSNVLDYNDSIILN